MIFNTGETSEELKARYNPEGSILRLAQLRMLEMIKYIDKICTENNIEYFLIAGNLLGAIRHKGFIPWDDDFDIAVSKKDFVKLSKILLKKNTNYVLQCHKTDRGFVRHYHVLRDKKSEYIKDELVHKCRKYRGVQIDIFPYETGVIKKGRRLLSLFVFFNERFLIGRHKFLSEVFFYFPNIFILPFLRFISFFRSKKTIMYGYNSIFSAEWKTEYVFPLKRFKYEDTFLLVPNNPEHVISNEYGENWKDLPPEVERNEHDVETIIFND